MTELLCKLLLCGICIPLPVIGDASGEDSASVEWCRFVHALAKSRPLDLLGKTDAGEPYMLEESNFGDKGTRATVGSSAAAFVGICKESPLMW